MSFSLYHYETLASTQMEALHLAQQQSQRGNFWVVADQQTAGRGRMGRKWECGIGNLYATACLNNVNDYEPRKALPFISGMSVHHTISPMLSEFARAHLKLKWPNDVLYAGAKLAGILIEVHSTGNHSESVVCIGFGINNVFAPEIEGRAITCLADIGIKLDTKTLSEKLSTKFEALWAEYLQAPNFARLLHDWQTHALPKGEPLCVNTHNGIKIGAFYGLDESGAMLLQLPNGEIETITAGDVDLLSPHTRA